MRRSVGLLVILVIFAAIVEAGSLQSYTFTVSGKTWTQIPEQYQQPTPLWKLSVGTWMYQAQHRQGNLYLHRIEKLGWRYMIKDGNGRIFILYAGRDWSFSLGTTIVISGQFDAAKVFIPQGERYYE